MEFTEKEIKRSIRNFENLSEDMLNADYETFVSKLIAFVSFINNDKVVYSIVKPLLDMPLDFNNINVERNKAIISLHLPSDSDEKIAFVLQILNKACDGKFYFMGYLQKIYPSERTAKGLLESWNYQIAAPCFRDLEYKLSDLIEDEVEGNETVDAASLQIFNISGGISAGNGTNVAIGSNITQTSTSNDISKEIIGQAIRDKLLDAENDKEKIRELESICEKLQLELSSNTPSNSKLKEFADNIFKLGGKALLKIANTVISNTQFSSSIAFFFLGQ